MEKGICPICGEENKCHIVLGEDPNSCWCMILPIERDILERIPKKMRDVSCICEKCNLSYNKEKKICKKYDLHSHTTASDGSYTPSELVIRAKKNALKGIAITDHDTIYGLKEGKEKAEEIGIEFINGIELSTNIMGRDVHILGYFLNLKDNLFLESLEKLKKLREERNTRIINKLEKYKIYITEKELKEEAKGPIISRLHIANLLINKGYVYSKNEAFINYLGKTGVAYEEKENFTPHMAVEILKKNGAFVSLAHPKFFSSKMLELETLVKELKILGLDGIEIEYPNFTKMEKNMYKELADKYDLKITGGSDFHGINRDGINLGCEGLTYSEFLDIQNIENEILRRKK
ncbi:MAG: cysteine-rich CWC family protein [Fusobacteriaceae bacterium]